MKSRKLKSEFKKLLSARPDSALPSGIISCMVDFYQTVRVDDCVLEEDGDMLLFDWGTYDWGKGHWFELGITRQVIHSDGEDDEIFQLAVKAKFPPSAELDALEAGEKWCSTPDELADFVTYMAGTEVMQRLGAERSAKMEIDYSCAG